MSPGDGRPGPFLVLTGPTGVGKTAVSLDVAERFGAEVVSADSRQVYRRLDIGTSKPTPDELARVRHHFVDEKDLGETWSAGRFAAEANARIVEILGRGHIPLVVGGSTLYLEALVHGLAAVPAAPVEIRAALSAEAHTPEGRRRLFAELLDADPATGAVIDPSNPHRLVRALEVLRATGRPFSHFVSDAPRPPFRYRVVVLTRPREALYARIDERVDAMLDAGLVEENRKILEGSGPLDAVPLRTIGYQEPLAFLRGEVEYDEMVRGIKQNTRRFAKRQSTWFRRRPEYGWLDLATDLQPAITLTRGG